MLEVSTRRLIGLSALNYLRRPLQSRLEGVILFPVLVQLVLLVFYAGNPRDSIDTFHLMGAMFFAIFVTQQWRQAIAYPQAKNIPGYRKIQTLVLILLLTIYTVLCISLTGIHGGADKALMMLALYLIIFSYILLIALVPSKSWLMLPWIGVWIWISSIEGRTIVRGFLLSNHGATAILLSILALIAICCLIRYSLYLDEETPGFNPEALAAIAVNSQSATRSTGKYNNPFGRFLFGPTSSQIRSAQRSHFHLRRWQIGMVGMRQALIIAIGSVIVATLLRWFLPGGKNAFAGLLFTISIGVPTILSAASWGMRSTRVAADLLRPVSRTVYFRQLFLAALGSWSELWIILNVTLVAGFYFFDPYGMKELPGSIAISLAINILFFGISAWLARYGENIPMLFVVSMVVVIPLVVALVSYLRPSDSVFPWCVAGFGILGIGLTLDAYRRWLCTEVGLIGTGTGGRSMRSPRAVNPKLGKMGLLRF